MCDNGCMRPYGTANQLSQRRQRALAWLQRGQSAAQVAKRIGTTTRSVQRWHRKSQTPTHKSGNPAPGRPSRLSAAQLRSLVQALKRGAYAYGHAEDYWTLDRIAHLIWELFQVRYRPSGVWYVLQRLEWSCQRPQRRTFARDDEAVAHWKHFVWPHIKKVASTGRDPGFCR
jgi:transposase